MLYEQLPAGRRQRLHQQIGEREEAAYGERAREIATELAVHFEQGRDYPRTVQYLQQAGENALRRSAPQEALTHLTKGLELLKLLPDTPERVQQEIALQMPLGLALMLAKGFGAPEVEHAYTRASELCRQLGDTPQLFHVLMNLVNFYGARAQHPTAYEIAQQCLHLAQCSPDPALLLEAHRALVYVLFSMGEMSSARLQLEQGLALYDPQRHHSQIFLYGHALRGLFPSL